MTTKELEKELSNSATAFGEMKKRIKKQGGLLYQYRPCYASGDTVYDIDNIIHEVLFARSPINMNDPFDSMIGFSNTQIYSECIELLLEQAQMTEETKLVLSAILKNDLLGKTGDFFKLCNEIKMTILNKRKAMRQTHLSVEDFLKQNIQIVYNKDYKKKINYPYFYAICLIIIGLKDAEITEETINQVFDLEEALKSLKEKINLIKEGYTEQFKTFLSKINVSCFSASGWNNTLMWAHYANSYSGICIEYDLDKMDSFIGFVYPIIYSKNRPTISIKEMGIDKLIVSKEHKTEMTQEQLAKLMTYLLVKDDNWYYEAEWRLILPIREMNVPSIIKFPYIKSITFGPRIKDVFKELLIEICRQKNIECYDLSLNTENFLLDRNKIDLEKHEFSFMQANNIICYVSNKIFSISEELEKESERLNESFNIESYKNAIEKSHEMVCLIYFANRLYNIFSQSYNYEFEETIQNQHLEFDKILTEIEVSLPTYYETIEKLKQFYIVDVAQAEKLRYEVQMIQETIKKHKNEIVDFQGKALITEDVVLTYNWNDYSTDYKEIAFPFLDEEAIKNTGCEDGFEDFYSYWKNELGADFWCKIVSIKNEPIAIIAFAKAPDNVFTIQEFIVSPNNRGKGYGSAILKELLAHSKEIIGQDIFVAKAVIYPDNKASQRVFEKANFTHTGTHPDGDALYYEYVANKEE